MLKKLNWGIVALIVFMISAGVFIYWNMSTVHEIKKQLAQDDKISDETDDKPQVQHTAKFQDQKPPNEPGFEWVRHGDHWDKVPINAHITPIEKDDIPVYEPPVTQTYFGPLTFHEELLKTNPVKALRLQSEERGHWSKDWIPPFPPDDEEAQEFARNEYLTHYYQSIEDIANPENEKAAMQIVSMMRIIMTYPFGPRRYDLMKLTWPSLQAGFVIHTDDTPSDYFPNYHTKIGLELLKPYYDNLTNK